jgi:hypothetical protein
MRRALLVLGMHRSGTSAFSRAAALLGAAGPARPMPPGPDNPSGFWEPESVAALNDEMLAAGQSSWADWTVFGPDRLPPGFMDAMQPRMVAALQDEYGDAPLFVLKDPRLSRLLPLWRPALDAIGAAPSALLALRHPAAVAQSLAARNGFPPGFSLLLWLRHTLDAERLTRGMPRAVASYTTLLDDWRPVMAQAAARMDLVWPTPEGDGLDAFLDTGLRHDIDEALPVASAYAEVWTRHLWTALQAMEQFGEDPRLADALDHVRTQFDDACRLFAPPLQPSAQRPAAPATRRRPDLRAVTLCAADSAYVPLTTRALRLCTANCDFGDAVLLSDAAPAGPFRTVAIPPLRSRDDYSAFMLRGLAGHVATSHALVVQWDGYVATPAAWDPAFLDYDYIGAPWGRYTDGMDVGNGGFSLRSRRLLDALQDQRFTPAPGVPEDELIGRVWRPALEREHNIRFAPPGIAARFAYERALPGGPTFGFHGLFNLWRHLDDDGLIAVVALLPAEMLTRREYAELAALCFLAGRTAVLPTMGARWATLPTGPDHAASLTTLLGSQATACLHAMRFG